MILINDLTNTKQYTVAELSNALKGVIEDRFSLIRVRGEVSGFRGPHSSGHVYFSIKDVNARIDAVIWKGAYSKMRVKPSEGLEVVAVGKVTTFAGKSTYQLIVESIEPAGVGALMAMLEERRKRLASEGLFDDDRKKQLPFLPRVLGVVTSPTGAVIRDIVHRVADRFPLEVLVWPVRVQGNTSGAEIASAVNGFNALPGPANIIAPDIIIIARGGGSLEDLWSFNDESVVRAVADSRIPVISAVGHETDWTLVDYVADVRAPTPTAAAEISVPVHAELLATIADLSRRHYASLKRLLLRFRVDLRSISRALPTSEAGLAGPRQQLDNSGSKLISAYEVTLARHHLITSRFAARLGMCSPRAVLARNGERLVALTARLKGARNKSSDTRTQNLRVLRQREATAVAAQLAVARFQISAGRTSLENTAFRIATAIGGTLSRRHTAFDAIQQMLRSLSYKSVLSRGFALIRTNNAVVVRTAKVLALGTRLDIEFADGHASAVVSSAKDSVVRAAKKRSKPLTGQPALF